MTIAKKHYEYTIRGRGVATDTEGTLDQANLTFPIDSIVINGVDIKLADLNSTQRTAIITAVELLVAAYKTIPTGA